MEDTSPLLELTCVFVYVARSPTTFDRESFFFFFFFVTNLSTVWTGNDDRLH